VSDRVAEQIALIGGTGDLGYGLALRWAAADVPIVIGSRDAGRAAEAAARVKAVVGLSAKVEGCENVEAARRSSTVVLSVPFPAQAGIVKSIKDALKNAILVDATVPLAATVGGKPTRLLGVWEGSAAEQARSIVPKEVPLVAAFHNLSAAALQDLAHPLDCDVLLCGDDAAAKERIVPLVKLIPGLRPVDAGPLEMARIVESLTALLISMNRRHKVPHAGLRITGLPT
jgi:8-hydroxy-5-deazaflavin:NADPH oxidoreductase